MTEIVSTSRLTGTAAHKPYDWAKIVSDHNGAEYGGVCSSFDGHRATIKLGDVLPVSGRCLAFVPASKADAAP